MDTQSHCPVPLQSSAELLPSIGSPSVRPLSLPGDSSTGAASHFGEIARGRGKRQKNTRTQDESYRRSTTSDMLPDDVLLEIFDFYLSTDFFRTESKWHILVHVCQRWRQIVFASPHRLNLRIICTPYTTVRKNLDVWPAFPIVVSYVGMLANDEDNAIAALEHPDRVCYLDLVATGLQLEKLAAAMQAPFPVLTQLNINSKDGKAPVIPSGFLGGSAPCLQIMELWGIPFPTLPILILSTSNLVELRLRDIPPAGYISPKAMVACLAALPRLAIFQIRIPLATSRSHRIPLRLSSVTPTVLPALTTLEFEGASEYLEDLVIRINSPQLHRIEINYSNQLVDFQVAQLSKFFDLSLGPKLTLFRFAQVDFQVGRVFFTMTSSLEDERYYRIPVMISIRCKGVNWQVSHNAHVLSQFSATLSNVVHLNLEFDDHDQLEGTDDVEWLHLLRQFSTVQTLRVSKKLAEHIAPVLEDITGEMVTEVLPSLDLIYLAGQPTSSVEKFIAARQLSDRPVTVFDTEAEFLTSVN